MTRFDLSRMLGHFTRESEELTGFMVLHKIVSEGALLASWSVRGGRRTIYGSAPAVCFTDMPLRALVEYVDGRGDRTRVSPHAVFVRKDEAFTIGARPVIYGLTSPGGIVEEAEGARTIGGLPMNEQYRYVAYDPASDRLLDWTHEREWRWRCPPGQERGRAWVVLVDVDGNWHDASGLTLYRPEPDGPPLFTELRFMVETRAEAQELLELLRYKADEGYLPRTVLDTVVVVVFQDLKAAFQGGVYDAARLPPELYTYVEEQTPTPEQLSQARDALARAREASLEASDRFAKEHPEFLTGDCSAFVHIYCLEPRHIMLRALISLGAAEANYDGGYRIDALKFSVASDRATYQESGA